MIKAYDAIDLQFEWRLETALMYYDVIQIKIQCGPSIEYNM